MAKAKRTMRRAIGALWPSTTRASLPTRVRERIAQNDVSSEVLVKIFQLIVFASWGLLYLAAPRPDPTTDSAVPEVIGLYLAVTLALLVHAALVRRPPGWLVTASIVVDMALLTYLIWSFHEQYGQPASFSLKAVEFANYFVLIGLRALRFQARYVLTAGALAVVGWTSLVIYAVETDPTDPMITRDYVTYLTSNTVLVGAEIAKLTSIIMFTLVLSVAMRRANGFFVGAIVEGSAVRDLTRFLPTPVADQIRDAEGTIQAGDGVRREAAVVYVDIRGFTTLVAGMEPAEAMRLLSDYQHRIVPLAHDHGGVIDKFMGDGIMATFGAARAMADHAACAARCVEAILDDVRAWPAPLNELSVNVAMSAGAVIFGAVGDADRLEFTVIGPIVNTAAKLEKHNKNVGSLALTDDASWLAARQQGFVPRLSVDEVLSEVDGVSMRLRAWS